MLSLLPRKYWVFLLVLFGLFALPLVVTETLRTRVVALLHPVLGSYGKRSVEKPSEKLSCENALLRNEVSHLRSFYLHHRRAANFQALQEELSSLQQKKLIARITHALPARVLYRDPYTWGSSLWISLGKEDLEAKYHPLLAKGAPVVFGNALVGVVDYVGNHQSRVRLITDSGVKPSVRVKRAVERMPFTLDEVERVAELFEDRELQEKVLSKAVEKLQKHQAAEYLAKGFLEGSSTPLWRSKGALLKGIGFNCDHEDALGPARDLHTGKVLEAESSLPPMPIIEKGDLLVTTGMDGVFPEGLEVATVHHVTPLSRGAVAFEITAKPIVKNLDSIQSVFILPPYSYDTEDGP